METDERTYMLSLTPSEAFLAVKCLTDGARLSWARHEQWVEDAPTEDLRERFDLALLNLAQGGEYAVAVTLRDCWTLALWLEVSMQVGQGPTGVILRNKVTQARLNLAVGLEATAQDPPITATEVTRKLREAQPWVKHPRDSRGRFRKRV